MRVPRVYLGQLPSEIDPAAALEGDEAAHLLRVLRIKVGADVEAFDGRGRAVLLEVRSVDRGGVGLTFKARLDDSRELPFAMTFAVSGPKGKRARRMIEGLTELGAVGIGPLLVEHNQKATNQDTLGRWALEACKQCKRNVVPEIHETFDIGTLALFAPDYDLRLIADTQDATPLRDALTGDRPEKVLVAIGPEGGFSDSERSTLRAAGFVSVGLGKSVLRVETAAHAVAAALVATWG
jgi:16S rRNA (uracil1498-N3)-methyltransferase